MLNRIIFYLLVVTYAASAMEKPTRSSINTSSRNPALEAMISKYSNLDSVEYEELCKAVNAKLALSDANKWHEPFTDLEKARILASHTPWGYGLHWAAAIRQYPELINDLLDYNPLLKDTINQADLEGQTPLDIAIARNNRGAQDILRRLGAK